MCDRRIWNKFVPDTVAQAEHYAHEILEGQSYEKLKYSLREDRSLPGIDMDEDDQIKILSKFHYQDKLKRIPKQYESDNKFCCENDSYGTGDAEYLYSIIRLIKPSKIIEIGCGSSTKMALLAIEKNKEEDTEYICDQICIEPYEQPWLEQLQVTVLRSKLEGVDCSLFDQLHTNDILFIDSSHIIRPQGDVLKEYLEILPMTVKRVRFGCKSKKVVFRYEVEEIYLRVYDFFRCRCDNLGYKRI